MIHFKGFTAGLLTGAAVGGLMGMVLEPLKGKNMTKIKKSAGNLMDSVGSAIDDMKK